MVMPADGPSLEIRDFGDVNVNVGFLEQLLSMDNSLARDGRVGQGSLGPKLLVASPSWPVSVSVPLPCMRVTSIGMMSPPASVHATLVVTPT